MEWDPPKKTLSNPSFQGVLPNQSRQVTSGSDKLSGGVKIWEFFPKEGKNVWEDNATHPRASSCPILRRVRGICRPGAPARDRGSDLTLLNNIPGGPASTGKIKAEGRIRWC